MPLVKSPYSEDSLLFRFGHLPERLFISVDQQKILHSSGLLGRLMVNRTGMSNIDRLAENFPCTFAAHV
jgi:hypothetical protein